MTALAVELKNLSKIFGDCVANSDINLKVQAGTIHAIIGENGAGKSTAMKMLFGLYPPTDGEIYIHGEKKEWASPAEAMEAKIGMVHQHFMLAGPLSVLDNIALGTNNPKKSWLPDFLQKIDRKALRADLEALTKLYQMPLDFDACVETLPVGIQQRVEIIKLLCHHAEILILDEPTAVLTPDEIQGLFQNLRRLKAEGKTIIIITHKLAEVLELTDRITVFRAGATTGEIETKDATKEILADLMVGRKVVLQVEKTYQSQEDWKKKSATIELKDFPLDLKEKGQKKLSFTIRKGEVLGIAGVQGNGQSQLIQALMSPQDHQVGSSQFFYDQKDIGGHTTHQLRELGFGLIPEDRHKEGLLMEFSLEENFMLGRCQEFFGKQGILRPKELRASVKKIMDDYDVRPRNISTLARTLSGGNQQKSIIGKEFSRSPKVILISEPTRGVDVGAIEFIHKKILEMAAQGATILLISSELEEVLALSDRVLVLYEGEIKKEFIGPDYDIKKIGLAMGGGK